MQRRLIKSPADLRPGDIMLGPIGGATGWLIVGLGMLLLGEVFRVGKFSSRHMAIVTGVDADGIRLAEAMPSGAREVRFDPEQHWTERHAWVRLPEDFPGQAEEAGDIARCMVGRGVRYSFASYLALALWRWGVRPARLARWIDRRDLPGWTSARTGLTVLPPAEAICSVLVDQAWTLAGKQVMTGTSPQVVTPGAFAVALHSFPGAVWTLPLGFQPIGTSPPWGRSWIVSGDHD